MKTLISKRTVNIITLFVLSLFLAGSPAFAGVKSSNDLVKAAKAQITEVTPRQVYMDMLNQKSQFVLDVRTEAEFRAGHLPNAENIPRGLLEFKVGKWIKNLDTPIVVYCQSGARGALAAQTLQEMGYTNVTNINTAFAGWIKADYPIHVLTD